MYSDSGDKNLRDHDLPQHLQIHSPKRSEKAGTQKIPVSPSTFPEMFFSVFQILAASTRHQLPEKAQLLKASGQLPYPHLRILHSWIDLFIDSLCNKAA